MVEVLRLCIVVFFAGIGFEVTRGLATRDDVRLGPFDAAGVGVIIGASVGYVLGGVVARLTSRTLVEAEAALSERSAEQVLAGAVGAVLGVMLAAGLTWPILLLGSPVILLPVFVFTVVTVGTLGYRLGMSRRRGVLTLIGSRMGLAEVAAQDRQRPMLLDSSVAIDGRIVDVVRAGFLTGTVLVCQPVMAELQGLADAGDDTRRARGRRGLDVLTALRREGHLDVEAIGDEAPDAPEVDAKLVRIAHERDAVLLTLDSALAKVAALAGCRVMNLHALTLALRPLVTAGDAVSVLLTRAGKEAGQGVGYLDDGTMVVVERSREQVGSEVSVQVTSVLTTANGRLVFARRIEPNGHR